MVDPFYFSFQPVLHIRGNKGFVVWDGAHKRFLAANRQQQISSLAICVVHNHMFLKKIY